MKLSDEQKQSFLEKLTANGVTSTCPMCGSKDFKPMDDSFAVDFHSRYMGLSSSRYVLISLFCNHCKFLAPFSLKDLGITGISSEKEI
jgi:predicted nucleic-acid-binding Zn-ribbon protein